MDRFNGIGDTIWYAFQQFFSFLPSLLGAAIILAIGWLISGWLAKLIMRGLSALGLESAVQNAGIGEFIRRSGTNITVTQMIAELIKWFIRLIFIQAAANILGMPQVTEIINSIVLFIPNVIVAVVIIIIGSWIARFLSGAVRASTSGMGNSEFLAKLTQYAIIGFAVIAAINQLGIAQTVVNTLFIGLVASIALAIGLAFGLGGKDVAGRLAEKWYGKGENVADQASPIIQPGAGSPGQ